LGYDDHDPAASLRMHQHEDQLLGELGYGAVYARESKSAIRHTGKAGA
jgi:ssRNA-specific RNase YbeY (16S rRNA maturation enzyme)